MSEVSQGPGWWQASDLKWYPPELHADYVAPPPPATPTLPPPSPQVPPSQPPAAAKGLSGQRKIVVLAGLALLAFADLLLIPVNYPPAPVVLVAIAIIVVMIAVRSGQSVSSVIATVLVVVVLPAAGGILGRLWFPSSLGAGSSSGVAGSPDGGQPSTQGGPPGGSTPASGYTWAQLSHDYPGLRTPCTKQPNAAGRLQCYWSHYSNVGSAESSAKQLPAGALRDNLLVNFDFYRKNYPQVSNCTKATLTTNFGCISGAQSLDTYDDEIASIIQAGLAGR